MKTMWMWIQFGEQEDGSIKGQSMGQVVEVISSIGVDD